MTLRKLYGGRIYIPKDVRKQVNSSSFTIRVDGNRIIMDPHGEGERAHIDGGLIYLPADVRKKVRASVFNVYVDCGRIVLEPVEVR
jgi:bifunctional DNA-binding transcriptional regulator/antitoxin component of YhaV-PrlF toxin-antitoxin module